MSLEYTKGKPYFIDKNKDKPQCKYLDKNIITQVAIIGGGVTGSLCGYYLTKSSIDTVILEKSRIAHGSTSITTSLLQYELDSNAEALTEYTTLENVEKSYKLGIMALKEIDDFIKKYGNNCEYSKRDTLLYTAKTNEIEELKREYEFRKQAGLDVKYIDKENNPFCFDVKSGVYSIDGGAELDPYQFTQSLLKVGKSNGLNVYENTEVVSLSYDGDRVIIKTQYGYTVTAEKVIIATGYDTDTFTKETFGTKTVTYNIVTKPIENLDFYYNNALIRDNNDTYNYFRTTKDKRIIAGGQDLEFETNIGREKVAEEKYDILYDTLKRMFPAVKKTEIEYTYCGAFASTNDNLGFVGEDKDHKNKWYCLGYGANGILFAVLGGMMLTKLYNGEYDENLKLFYPYRFDRNIK